jgi:hypothetical protein
MGEQDELAELVRQHGFTEGVSPHSWRCYNPDRFPGYCTCVTDLAEAVLDSDWLKAHDAEVAAKALERAADELTNKPFVKSWPVSWMPANTLGGAAAYLRAYAGECRETTESEGN